MWRLLRGFNNTSNEIGIHGGIGMDYEQAKELCIQGKMTTRDAAFECGWKLSTFYKSIKNDKEAYMVFLSNMVWRDRLKTIHTDEREMAHRNKRRIEQKEECRLAEVMARYHSKTLEAKAKVAKQLGISYGKFMALARGLGRLSDEA
jgi:hypothetical protein